MQEIYFLARHIPFWGVPMIIIGFEFAYMFWLKKKKASVVFCLMFVLVGLLSTSFYIWAGGPERSVKILKKLHRDHK
jgi:hypothetical protein